MASLPFCTRHRLGAVLAAVIVAVHQAAPLLGEASFGDGERGDALSLLQVQVKQQRSSNAGLAAVAQEPATAAPADHITATDAASRFEEAGEALKVETEVQAEAAALNSQEAIDDTTAVRAFAPEDPARNIAPKTSPVSWRVWFSMARQAGILQFAFDTLDKSGFRRMSKRVLIASVGASMLLTVLGCIVCIGLLDVNKARKHAASQRRRMPRQTPFDDASTTASGSGGSSSDANTVDSDNEALKKVRTAPKTEATEIKKDGTMAFLPSQADSHCYYKWLLPIFLAPTCGMAWLVFAWLPAHGEGISQRLEDISNWTLACLLLGPLLWRIGVHVVEGTVLVSHLSAGLEGKELVTGASSSSSDAPPEPLLHIVVVPAYNEPWSVLCRTIGSLAEQSVPKHRRCLTLAFEACDPNAEEMYRHICTTFGRDFGRIWRTFHVLQEGEDAGKSANENFAVRWLYKELVPQHDPDNVMITIADADSDFAPRYLEQVESTFSQQLNGHCYMYDGLLSTWGNYLETQNPLIKHIELMRCVRSWQGQWRLLPPDMPSPESNYSLTLGLAQRIDYWTPDQMHEDLHTFHKVQLSLRYGTPTVPVYSFICNDLVTDFKDRYVQAQRHAWGITEVAWAMALFNKVEFRIFMCIFSQTMVAQFVSRMRKAWPLMLLVPSVQNFIGLLSPRVFRYWVLYYGAHLLEQWTYDTFLVYYAWFFVLRDRATVPKPPLISLLIIRFMAWPLDILSEVCFSVVPFWLNVLHAFRTPHFKYVNAPKGTL